MNKNKNRAEQILLKDKMQETNCFTEVVRSDVYYILNNYFQVAEKSLSINVDVDDYGIYTININCKADKLKRVKTLYDN